MSEYRKELISPDGERYVATSAREANDLLYGGGYIEADEPAETPASVDEAAPVSSYEYGGGESR